MSADFRAVGILVAMEAARIRICPWTELQLLKVGRHNAHSKRDDVESTREGNSGPEPRI